MSTPYEPKSGEICGFDMIGTRLENGKLALGFGKNLTIVDDFPSEVMAFGNVYTLEARRLFTADNKVKLQYMGEDLNLKNLKSREDGVYV